MGSSCCSTSKTLQTSNENVFKNRISSALAKNGTWNNELFKYDFIKSSKVIFARHYLIYSKQSEYHNGEMSVLIKLFYKSTIKQNQNPVPGNATEPEYQRELYPISILVFPVRQNIITYEIPEDIKFKQTDCAYFNITIKNGERYVIVPVINQLHTTKLDYKMEVRPRDDINIIDLEYNSDKKLFESQYDDIIRVHMRTCYRCQNFLFDDENIVTQRGLAYHYDCAKYTCQLCNLEIQNRNETYLCNGMVYHKACLDTILRCSKCNEPSISYYNSTNGSRLCEKCFLASLIQMRNKKVETKLIKFSD